MSRDVFRYPAIETLAREGGGTESRAIRNLAAERRAVAAEVRRRNAARDAAVREAARRGMEDETPFLGEEAVNSPGVQAMAGMTPDELRYAATHGVEGLASIPEDARDAAARIEYINSRRNAMERQSVPGSDESDFAALSGFVPFEDELYALGDVIDHPDLGAADWNRTREGYENRFSGATRAHPLATVAGGLGLAAAAAPARLAAAVPEGLSGLAALRAATRAAAPLAGAGAALGGVLGAAEADEGERLQGGALGALYGGASGLAAGVPLSYAARSAAAAPSLSVLTNLRNAGTAAALEGVGSAAMQGYEASTRGAADVGRLGDVGAAAGVGGLAGGVLGGTIGGLGRYMGAMRQARQAARPSTGRVDDVIPDEAVTVLGDLADEASAQADEAPIGVDRVVPDFTETPQTLRERIVQSATQIPDYAARARALGAVDRAQVKRMAQAFGGGESGLRRAVQALEEAGVYSPGQILPVSRAVRNVEAVRDAARTNLARTHAQVAASGVTSSGDDVARVLEDEARRLRTGSAPEQSMERASRLVDRATDLRYGNRGVTPERARYDAIARAESRLGETRTGVPLAPGVADDAIPEIDATMIPEVPPQQIPYAELRDSMARIHAQRRAAELQRAPTTASDLNLVSQYRALQQARDAAMASQLSPQDLALARQDARTFNAAQMIAPADQLATHTVADTGKMTGSIARNTVAGGAGAMDPRGILAGFAERITRDYEPAVLAAIAETGLPTQAESLRSATSALLRATGGRGLPPDVARSMSVAARGGSVSRAERQAIQAALDGLDPRALPAQARRAVQMDRNVRNWPTMMRAVAEMLGREAQEPTAAGQMFRQAIAGAIASGIPASAAVYQAIIRNPASDPTSQPTTIDGGDGGEGYAADTIDEYGNPIDPGAAPAPMDESSDEGYAADTIDEYGNPIDPEERIR